MFGNMRLANGGAATAMLVPSTAIETDQAGKIVLTVGDDNIVAAKPVELGPEVDGLRVVTSGLTASDRVIVGNIVSAIPGVKVQTQTDKISPKADAASIASTARAPVAAQATFTTN